MGEQTFGHKKFKADRLARTDNDAISAATTREFGHDEKKARNQKRRPAGMGNSKT